MSNLVTEELHTKPVAPRSAAPEAEEPFTVPEKSLREWGIALSIGVLSCVYLMAFRRITTLNPDEGISLQAAQRILHGQIPYRDFFSLVTPGSYYWTALLFKVFGDSILVARTALVVYGGVFSLLTYLLARRVCSRRNAALGACLLTVTCLPNYFVFEHNWDSTVWACLALYCAVRLLEERKWYWAFAVGFLASLTCLFEQSKGGGLVLGLAAGFLLVTYSSGGRSLFNRKRVAALVTGFSLPLLATLGYFGAKHSLAPMLADWLWPLKYYNSVNRVPYGFIAVSSSSRHALHYAPLAWKVFVLFTLSPCFLVPVLPILAAVVLARYTFASRDRIPARERAYYLLVCSCTAGLLLSVLVARPEFNHLMYLAPILYLVLCWIFEGKAFSGTILPTARPAITAYVLLSFSAFGLAWFLSARSANRPLASRRGVLRTDQPDTVVSYVQEHLAENAPIFMYPYQPLYYYLTGSTNPTSYEFLYPGYNTPAQFDKAARQLETQRTPVVLLAPGFPGIGIVAFPGTPMKALAKSDPMVDFIFSRYRSCKVLNSAAGFSYVYMERKDLACPKDSDSKQKQSR